MTAAVTSNIKSAMGTVAGRCSWLLGGVLPVGEPVTVLSRKGARLVVISERGIVGVGGISSMRAPAVIVVVRHHVAAEYVVVTHVVATVTRHGVAVKSVLLIPGLISMPSFSQTRSLQNMASM